MTMTPLPIAPIPLWIGGSSEAALKRDVRLADGWHGSRETPEQTAAIVRRLRAQRPGADFTISTRVNWDGRDLGELRARVAAYEAAGVQHIMVASDLLRSAEIETGTGSSRASAVWSRKAGRHEKHRSVQFTLLRASTACMLSPIEDSKGRARRGISSYRSGIIRPFHRLWKGAWMPGMSSRNRRRQRGRVLSPLMTGGRRAADYHSRRGR